MKKPDMNWRLLGLMVGVLLLVGIIYPVTLWFFLDIGLDLHLGMLRVYALWFGFAVFSASIGWLVYLLQPDEKPQKPRQMWRVS
jgi:hypothetical protein